MLRKWPLVLSALLALPCQAQDAARPAEIAGQIHARVPYGTAAYDYLAIPVYEASLWTDAALWSMQSAFALSLSYKMNISREELVERSLGEMNQEKTLSPREREDYAALLTDLLPDVSEGDRVTALYVPGQNLAIYHNGKLTGRTTNMPFARRFLNIWLSPATSAPAMRQHLLHVN